MMFKYPSLQLCITLTSVLFITSACTAQLSGKAKRDSTWSAETGQLESEASAYTGPQYTIGIVQFDNKATARLRTQLEAAGLNTVAIDEKAPKDMDTSKAPRRPGTVNNGKTPVDNGLDTVDFHLSGAITAYSEVEEGVDTTATQKISVVARVNVDYVLIESATGEQLLAESVSGEFRKPASGAFGQAARSSIDSKLRDGALRNALAKTTVTLIHKLGSIPFQGRLLAVDGPSLVLRAGRRSQLKVGTLLAVYRMSKALVDPDNGRVLGYRANRTGIIQIGNHLNENLSSASVVSGTSFQAGDMVKLLP